MLSSLRLAFAQPQTRARATQLVSVSLNKHLGLRVSSTQSLQKLHTQQIYHTQTQDIGANLNRLMSFSTGQNNDESKSQHRVKVYTKTGDKGTTQLYNMQRLPKNSDYFEALGNTDELNAHIGLAREHVRRSQAQELDEWLEVIQCRLLDAGSAIATPLNSSPENRVYRAAFPEETVEQLERWIDQMDESLPPLTNFILPSGGLASSALHVCRCVTRRAERSVIELVERGDLDEVVMRYFNRLSDFFFVAARYASSKDNSPETVYKKHVERRFVKPQASDSHASAESSLKREQ